MYVHIHCTHIHTYPYLYNVCTYMDLLHYYIHVHVVYVPCWFCPLAMAFAVLATWVVADAISLTLSTRLWPPASWLGHTSILDFMSIMRHREASASALACCTNSWTCSVGLHTHAHIRLTIYVHFYLHPILKKMWWGLLPIFRCTLKQ